MGIALALTVGNPSIKITKAWSGRLLQLSVVGLGAGMNLGAVFAAGSSGVVYTIIGIILTLALGMMLGKLLGTSRDLSLLLSTGTAICGGSAIAAVASSLDADDRDISLSLVTVFFLNAVALFLFPFIGHHLEMTQTQFGYWSALAIHDTSSVVGASMAYGPQALQLATVVKLARALWIVPIALVIGIWHTRDKSKTRKTKWPWFILGFLFMAALVTWVPSLRAPGDLIQNVAKRGLVLTLFLIGTNMPRGSLKDRELRRAIVQGIGLWVIVATATLAAIQLGWIH
jgi:uncharacterized integral membrane protein (TIGR00698 family)